jgi:hypothetical protein
MVCTPKGEGMKPLTEADLAWLENRIGAHRWTPEDMGRILADLREAREALAVPLGMLSTQELWEVPDGR